MLLEMREYYPDWPFTEIGTDKHHVRVHMDDPSEIRRECCGGDN
ncbi:MAG: hypothetical protein OJF51_003734 [Nitrospira sp.]|nr:MAG: hypothetical protein OJF51_003734 [Nitrospira sp.]